MRGVADNKDNSSACYSHRLASATLLAGFITLYFAAMPLLDDPDVPWHLATGALLLSTHVLPATDPWSFASGGAPWYLLSWLWNMLLGIIEATGGAFSVFTFAIAVSAGLLAAQAWRLSRLGIDPQAVLLTLLLMTLCMVEFASARPHLAGYVLILCFHHCLHRSRTSNRYGSLLLLPALMVVWVNAHGSFIAGFTLLAAYMGEACITRNRKWLARLGIVTAASCLAILLNPYGVSIITGAMQSIDSDVKEHLIEWGHFSIGKSIGLSVWLLAFVLASNIRNAHVPLADKIISFAWLTATLLIMRNGAVFVLVSAPYLASCLDVQTRGLRRADARLPGASWIRSQPPRRLWRLSVGGIALFIILAALLPHDGRLQSDARSVQDAIAYIQSHEPDRRYLSDFDFGGQVIYYTGGGIAFFMDSRSNTAYASREMKNYLAFWLQQPGWQEKIRAYGIDGIIAHRQSRFAKAHADGQYEGHWHLVFAGNMANVYIAAP